MKNPWEYIELDKYEKHMESDSVKQLQTLDFLMNKQFNMFPIKSVMILGIAGGNGLKHIDTNKIHKIYGIDINRDYLTECKKRYSNLGNSLECICADLSDKDIVLPYADMVIANLLIEYIGYDCCQQVITKINPKYVSCVIQKNTDNGFVSSTPYTHIFDYISSVHTDISEECLNEIMEKINYHVINKEKKQLPNQKELVMLTYKK